LEISATFPAPLFKFITLILFYQFFNESINFIISSVRKRSNFKKLLATRENIAIAPS